MSAIQTTIELGDFLPINKWEPSEKICPYSSIVDSKLTSKEVDQIVDELGRKYLKEEPAEIRVKCLLLTLGTPVQTLALIANLVKCILKLISFWNFWAEETGDKPYNFKANLTNAGKDLLRVVATPFALIGLVAAATYGMISPLNGRKLYATIERAMYDDWRLARCFQPNIQPNSIPVFGEKRAF